MAALVGFALLLVGVVVGVVVGVTSAIAASALRPTAVAYTYDSAPHVAQSRGGVPAGAAAVSPRARSGWVTLTSQLRGRPYGSAVAAEGISPTVGELRAAGQADAHHIIQDAAVRDVPGYKTNSAPGIQLEGGGAGTPHQLATNVQRTAGIGGTYGSERQVACMALAAAGCSPAEISGVLARADAYFMDEFGLTFDSPLRIPGNRSVP